MVIKRLEQFLLLLDYLKNTIIVTHNTTEINGNNGLGFLSNRSFESFIVHLRHMGDRVTVFLDVYELYRRSAMNSSRRRSSISIGRNDNLIAFLHTKDAKIQFFSSGRRIQTYNPLTILCDSVLCGAVNICPTCFDISCQTALKHFCAGTSRDPTGTQCFSYFFNFKVRNIRRTKTNNTLRIDFTHNRFVLPFCYFNVWLYHTSYLLYSAHIATLYQGSHINSIFIKHLHPDQSQLCSFLPKCSIRSLQLFQVQSQVKQSSSHPS